MEGKASVSNTGGRLVPAVSRAADVLELLLESNTPLSAGQISSELGLPRTTVHELVTTLVHRRYINIVDGDVRRFTLGPMLLRLGARFEAGIDIAHDSRVVAERVGASCGETVHAAELLGREVVYIAKVDTSHAVRMVSAVGRRLPAHVTAVGKALLATRTDAQLDDLFPRGTRLAALTPHSITKVSVLRAELDKVRESGIATEWCESNAEVGCVAAAARDHEGRGVVAISISVPVSRHTPEKQEEWARLVADGAEELTRRLG